MTRQCIELIQNEMDEAYRTLRERLQGMTDEEFLWEPVPGCWTVHLSEGRWVVDYELPEPLPPPFTTIGWRLVHVASCKIMYHEYAFGPARQTWDEIEYPHNAQTAISWLEEGQNRLQKALSGLEDDDLNREVLTNWGESWPIWRIFWTMIHHDLNHGGEIACLRDLYRIRRKELEQTGW